MRACNIVEIMSNPRFIIEKLVEAGMTEAAITEEVRASGVEVTAATINRIRHGKIKRTGYDIGAALVRLQERRLPQRQSA